MAQVGVLDEEALLVVVGVYEQTGDVVRRAAMDGSGRRVVDVEAPDLDDQPSAVRSSVMSGSPKTVNRFPAPVGLSSASPIARSGLNRTNRTGSRPYCCSPPRELTSRTPSSSAPCVPRSTRKPGRRYRTWSRPFPLPGTDREDRGQGCQALRRRGPAGPRRSVGIRQGVPP